MEATKKTSATRAALLVLAALSMLLSGLFIATASRSDASPPPACPDGFSLTADQKNCFAAATITNTVSPNTCAEGQLTPDGSKCYLPARLIPQEGVTLCPKGYSPDDSLLGMCARFEAAKQKLPGCPEGARGVAGACYILVAKGPAGTPTCTTGTLAGTQCVITGAAPVNGPASCPESATVIKAANGECYTLIARPAPAACVAPYVMFGVAGTMVCKVSNPNPTSSTLAPQFVCPTVAGVTIVPSVHTIGGITKIESCSYAVPAVDTTCPTGTTPDPNGTQCRRPVDLTPGAQQCAAGFGLVDGKCIRYENANLLNAACPTGSVEDSRGDCRKPVANAAGAFFCEDPNAALNGRSCVWTTGFLVEPSPNLYKCEKGVSTVIGSGAGTQVICLLAATPNKATTPSCVKGVLSTDGLYCVVPRIDTAPAAGAVTAPVPAFTG